MAQTIVAPQWGTASQQAGIPTEEDIGRRRALAMALASRAGPARNVGEGLSALGAAMGGALAGRRADAMEAQRGQALMQALSSGAAPEDLMKFSIAAQSPMLYQYATQQQAWKMQEEQRKADKETARQKWIADNSKPPEREADGRWYKTEAAYDPAADKYTITKVEAPAPGTEAPMPRPAPGMPDPANSQQFGDFRGGVEKIAGSDPAKAALQVTQNFNAMIEAHKDALNTPAGKPTFADRALIVGFAKILAPNEAVMRDDAKAIMDAVGPYVGPMERVKALWSGQSFLSAGERTKLMELARNMAEQKLQDYEGALQPQIGAVQQQFPAVPEENIYQTPRTQHWQPMGEGPTLPGRDFQPGPDGRPQSGGLPSGVTAEDVLFTAQKYNISPEEVVKRLSGGQ